MSKIITTKPLFIMLYGFPGAGKTYFAKQLSQTLGAAHVHGDKLRNELFENPKFDKKEDEVIEHLMQYMTEEFLRTGISVIYDTNSFRLTQRRELRDMARKAHSQNILVWLQIDPESAMIRLEGRDKRKNDDKYAKSYDKSAFDELANRMQNPVNEDYMVISGKHTYNTQKSAVIKKLYTLGLITSDLATSKVIKPGLVNLVPNPRSGRVDLSRRNILIR